MSDAASHGPVHSALPEYLAGCGCSRCMAHDRAVGVPALVEWLKREPNSRGPLPERPQDAHDK